MGVLNSLWVFFSRSSAKAMDIFTDISYPGNSCTVQTLEKRKGVCTTNITR